MPIKNGAPQLTWGNIILTVSAFLALAVAAGTIIQGQLGSLERNFAERLATLSSTESLRQRSSDRGIEELQHQLERLRDRVIIKDTQAELVKRIDDNIEIIQERIKVIESTRPTTGELQALNRHVEAFLIRLEERIRSLERR